MNIKDLMIGDWVIRKGVPEEPMCLYDMKVWAGIAYLVQDGRGVTEKFENIEPIPLTEEILRNNGFIKVDYLKYDEPRVGISLLYKDRSNGEEGYRVLIENRKPGIETRTTIKPAKYVHEIQHTIKDLNIDREITLL